MDSAPKVTYHEADKQARRQCSAVELNTNLQNVRKTIGEMKNLCQRLEREVKGGPTQENAKSHNSLLRTSPLPPKPVLSTPFFM